MNAYRAAPKVSELLQKTIRSAGGRAGETPIQSTSGRSQIATQRSEEKTCSVVATAAPPRIRVREVMKNIFKLAGLYLVLQLALSAGGAQGQTPELVLSRRHTMPVSALGYSRDGKLPATARGARP